MDDRVRENDQSVVNRLEGKTFPSGVIKYI